MRLVPFPESNRADGGSRAVGVRSGEYVVGNADAVGNGGGGGSARDPDVPTSNGDECSSCTSDGDDDGADGNADDDKAVNEALDDNGVDELDPNASMGFVVRDGVV